jgi:hypothetical protein
VACDRPHRATAPPLAVTTAAHAMTVHPVKVVSVHPARPAHRHGTIGAASRPPRHAALQRHKATTLTVRHVRASRAAIRHRLHATIVHKPHAVTVETAVPLANNHVAVKARIVRPEISPGDSNDENPASTRRVFLCEFGSAGHIANAAKHEISKRRQIIARASAREHGNGQAIVRPTPHFEIVRAIANDRNT